MKFKKISTRMFVTILPVILIAMVVLTVVSIRSSRTIIDNQISSTMNAQLLAQAGEMGEYLDSVSSMATTIADMVETSYKAVAMSEYEKMLGNIIKDNDIVLGSGLWFEPYVYDPNEKYMGPYVYKDGAAMVTTYDYSNADYDYFSQEYYTMCIGATKAQFTDPYYDETSDTVMSSCSCPIIADGKYIGCVTVDIELGSITELVEGITIGESGSAMLTTGDGTYLAGVDDSKVASAANITADENSSLAAAGAKIIADISGKSVYTSKDGKTNLYYSTLEETGWKLILQMPQAELNAPITGLVTVLAIVSGVAIVFVIFSVLMQVSSIAKSVGQVNVFAGALAEGDFTVDQLKIASRDELGSMGDSLNRMYASNKDVINNIKHHSSDIDEASSKLRVAASTLSEKFGEIQSYMNDVNNAMLSTSAATEEVNASTEEVLSNVNLLAQETQESMNMAGEIRNRAAKVGSMSKAAYDSATELSGQFESRLNTSIENSKVVESIGELANVISDIAEQINLLSLNASIEAARAGDAGRGFAVVASEIGSLAGNTADAVSQIQQTISGVKEAFSSLAKDAQGLLGFVRETVAPDYQKFVSVAEQYGKDAQSIDDSSNRICEMSDAIKLIMQEVTDAVQSIAEATQDTTELGSNIMISINAVSENVTDISDMSDAHDVIVKDLNDVVSKFVIK